MYIPDRWLIVKINDDLYKVFATWVGGYLQSDSWKMNSGIARVDEDDEYYNFYGYSGSVYSCRKTSYGSTGYGYDVLSHFKGSIDKVNECNKKLGEPKIADSLEILDDRNWMKFFEKS